ncbi:hypothetical protein D043_5251B, partial [Vibrio parahaemolyticus EKP-021]
TYRLSG